MTTANLEKKCLKNILFANTFWISIIFLGISCFISYSFSLPTNNSSAFKKNLGEVVEYNVEEFKVRNDDNILNKFSPSNKVYNTDSLPPNKKVSLQNNKALSDAKQRLDYTKKAAASSRKRIKKTSKKILKVTAILPAKPTVAFPDIPNVSFNFPVHIAKNFTPADSLSKIFFTFLNKYYQLQFLDSLIDKIDSSSILGRISIKADTSLNTPSPLISRPAKGVAFGNDFGVMTIDSFQLKWPSIGNRFIIDKQTLLLDPTHIYLKDFLVKDISKNTLIINGEILSSALMPSKPDLKLALHNFTLFQVQKAIDNKLYGSATVTGNATVTGTTIKPIIKGDIQLNDNSDITIVLPQNNLNKAAEKSVVSFFKNGSFVLPVQHLVTANTKNTIKKRDGKFDINLIAKSPATIKIIVDPSTGDELNLHGNAALKILSDTAGSLLVRGTYNLDSGYYRLNNQYLQRQFQLLPGSNIVINGLPENALLNIKTAFKINTSAYDLLKNEIGYLDKKDLHTLKEDATFKVLLNLSGSVNNLKIGFDITLDTNNLLKNDVIRRAIENKLIQLRENVSVTNKQIFSLLLYGRFVGEQSDDFFNSAGAGGTRFDEGSYQSVSGFLSAALDNIAEDLFKTLDIYHNLNNYKDYGNGDAQQKTAVNIDATKSFINDRVSLNVGKNYGIDGEDASAKAARQKGAGFLPDVTLVYKFTKDGKYIYRSYKKTQFEITVDGFLTESGISVLLNLDYDNFSDLLNRPSTK